MSLNSGKQLHLARLLLERHYDTPITVEALSRQVALSPYHLIRAFRNTYQQTPHQYLIDVRVAKAKELLRNSTLPITEVCAAVGYESLGSFSTLFRNLTGLSPRAYRAYSQPAPHLAYIPLCTRLLHDINEHEDS